MTSVRSISFSGCAWLLAYHMGVGRFLQRRVKRASHLFLGASSGAVAALMLASGIDFDEGFASTLAFARDSKRRLLGPVGRMTRYLSTGLRAHLPRNALGKVRDNLLISVTRLPFFRNELLTPRDFRSDEDLVQAVLASCYIPIYYERPIVFQGRLYVDGGLTNNIPVLGPHTITVSPTPSVHRRRFHIYPREEPPLWGALLPEPKMLKDLFLQGQEDARYFWTRGPG